MSHSKGLFSTCPGNFSKYRKPRDGIQQLKCPRCGQLKTEKVRTCWFFHDWKNRGRPKYGDQKQSCSRCGKTRTVQARRCLFRHQWSAKGQDWGMLQCKRCGMPRESSA